MWPVGAEGLIVTRWGGVGGKVTILQTNLIQRLF